MVWNLVEAIKHENLNFEFKFESLFSWSTPTVLSNTGMFEFEKFLRGSDFCQNRKGLVNGGVVIKRWRRSIFTLTNSFQCYFFWVFGVCVCIVSSPPGISGGDDLCVISQAGGQLLSFKSQSGDTFRGEDDFRQSSRGGNCFIMTNCWYFHKGISRCYCFKIFDLTIMHSQLTGKKNFYTSCCCFYLVFFIYIYY